jgi:hypothetical protein
MTLSEPESKIKVQMTMALKSLLSVFRTMLSTEKAFVDSSLGNFQRKSGAEKNCWKKPLKPKRF